MYLLLPFLQHLLVKLSKYYIQLFHQWTILYFFDMLLLHFVLQDQIFHLIRLYYILRYLSHLELLIHNYLHFLFLIEEILLYYMQANRNLLSKCTQVGVKLIGSTKVQTPELFALFQSTLLLLLLKVWPTSNATPA